MIRIVPYSPLLPSSASCAEKYGPPRWVRVIEGEKERKRERKREKESEREWEWEKESERKRVREREWEKERERERKRVREREREKESEGKRVREREGEKESEGKRGREREAGEKSQPVLWTALRSWAHWCHTWPSWCSGAAGSNLVSSDTQCSSLRRPQTQMPAEQPFCHHNCPYIVLTVIYEHHMTVTWQSHEHHMTTCKAHQCDIM